MPLTTVFDPTLSTGQGAKGKRLAGSGQRIDQSGLSSGISCRVDYLSRKTAPSSLAGSWFGFTSLVFALSGQTSDAGLTLPV